MPAPNPDRYAAPLVQFPNGKYQVDQYFWGGTSKYAEGLRIPGFHNVNLTVNRKFRLAETAQLEFLAEATNLFNQTNFNPSAVNGGVSAVLVEHASTKTKIGQNSNVNFGTLGMSFFQDGRIDVVLNKVWFENPGNLTENPDKLWPTHVFGGGGHDVIAADINGDGQLDVITYDGAVVSWFDTSAGLNQTDIGQGEHNHGGIAPNGAADLDADGDVDLVIPGYWFENPGKGNGDWQRHPWPHLPVERASYGTSMRVWIADINADSRKDIVYSDCDTGLSHVYWVDNMDSAMRWKRHQLPDPPTAAGDVPGTGSFHSLGVADFDSDGDLDIFAGEQEDPDTFMTAQGRLPMKPPGLKARGIIWLQSGR